MRKNADARMVVNAITFRANANVRPDLLGHCVLTTVQRAHTAMLANRNADAKTMALVIHKQDHANAHQDGLVTCVRIDVRADFSVRIFNNNQNAMQCNGIHLKYDN